MPRKSFYKQTAKVNATSTTTLLEIDKPAKFKKTDESPIILSSSGKWGAWFFLAGGLMMVFIVVILTALGWWYWRSFETAAQTNLTPLIQQLWAQRHVDPFGDQGEKTFLILGLDQSQNQRENEILTDTIIFGMIHQDGTIKMISIPRDLWIDSLKTKINALYYYGLQTNPDDGVALESSVITEITGLPVNYYMVINMDSLKTFVDAVGGLDIKVERSFEDNLYPREIDLTSKDPSVLYESIQFQAGLQHMNGDRALQYIRSRHSTDAFEGTDEGRERRQQVLLSALKAKLLEPEVITDPIIMGNLYRAWKTSVKTNVTDLDLMLLAKQLKGKHISINSVIVPVQDASNSGIIYNPKTGPDNQWVYLPVEATWKQFHQWFQEQL